MPDIQPLDDLLRDLRAYPMWWMSDVLNTTRATNFLLNFNMVAGNLPPGEAGAAVGFH